MTTNQIKCRKVMTISWMQAKAAARKFGGKPVEYLSECMKAAWKLVKSVAAPVAKVVVAKTQQPVVRKQTKPTARKWYHGRGGMDCVFKTVSYHSMR